MLGARLKSWVEAQLGRARRRRHKSSPARAPPRLCAASAHSTQPAPLSSPESAYSTGYSTDGTSPGAPPEPRLPPPPQPAPRPPPTRRPQPPSAPPPAPVHHIYHEPVQRRASCGHHRSESGGWCRAGPPPPPPAMVAAAAVRGDASATPSPRPRCRIRTNPWLSAAPSPATARRPGRAPLAPLSHLASPPPHRLQNVRCCRPRGGASSDEECRGACGRETAILSDADVDTDADTGLDGGDERDPEDELDSPASRRRARRRRPPPRRQAPRSAGATPPRARRSRCGGGTATTLAPACPAPPPSDPLLEADREAERKYRSLIREAERLLVCVSRAPPPLEPPHNPRVRLLRAAEAEPHRAPGGGGVAVPRSPERTHLTNFIRANSPPAENARRESPLARAPPPAPPQRIAPSNPQPPPPPAPAPTDRPHSEPPKRKSYTRDLMLVQTLEGLKRSLEQQSALLATHTNARRAPPATSAARPRLRLDSL